MRILLLEDSERRIRKIKRREEARGNTVKIVYGTCMMKDMLMQEDFDKLILDHDLQGRIFMSPSNPHSGYSAIKDNFYYIVNSSIREVLIHSWNPYEAFKMYRKFVGLDHITVKYRPCRWAL